MSNICNTNLVGPAEVQSDEFVFVAQLKNNDIQLVTNAVNQGIDSRLEGFVHSYFRMFHDHLNVAISDYTELQILIRRLLESSNENAAMLADDIVFVVYDIE